MATVRSPSSFAARKIRMAISLRLAASSFWIGLVFFITVVSELRCGSRGFLRRIRHDWHCRRRFQLLQLDLDFRPGLAVALCRIGRAGVREELREFRLYSG